MRKAWIAPAIYVAVFVMLEAYRWRIWSFGSDTGTFTQAILDVAHGSRDGPEGGSHYLFHFSPILTLLYPIVALTNSPLSLQIVQVLLVAATAPSLYTLVRPYGGDALAARLSLITLLYPPLAALAFGEFHELAFLPAATVWLVWAADRRKWWWFGVIAVACIAIREDVGVELAFIGAGFVIWALFSVRAARSVHKASQGTSALRGLLLGEPQDAREIALAFGALAVVSAVVVAIYYNQVTTVYGHWPHSHFYSYPFANGPLAVLIAVFTQPAAAIPAIFQLGRLTYLIEAFAPLAFLPLRSRWMLATIPGFAIVLVASEQSVWRMGNHYAALWAPWLLIATGAALIRLEDRQKASSTTRPSGGWSSGATWSTAAIAACLLTLIAFDPMHPIHYLTPPYADLESAKAALACVPNDASVSTHDEWFAEIAAAYPRATILATNGPQYLVYADDFANDRFASVMLPQLREDIRARKYRVVCSFGHVKTYKRSM